MLHIDGKPQDSRVAGIIVDDPALRPQGSIFPNWMTDWVTKPRLELLEEHREVQPIKLPSAFAHRGWILTEAIRVQTNVNKFYRFYSFVKDKLMMPVAEFTIKHSGGPFVYLWVYLFAKSMRDYIAYRTLHIHRKEPYLIILDMLLTAVIDPPRYVWAVQRHLSYYLTKIGIHTILMSFKLYEFLKRMKWLLFCLYCAYTVNYYRQNREHVEGTMTYVWRVFRYFLLYVWSVLVKPINWQSSRVESLEEGFVDLDLDLNKKANRFPPTQLPIEYADRGTVSLFCTRYCEAVGLNEYIFQMSLADQKAGKRGSRRYFWPCEMEQEERPYRPAKDDIVVMIDVDYYINMPQMLAEDIRPYLIRTIQPTTVAMENDKYSYTFMDDKIHYRTGNRQFTHYVWHYNKNYFTVHITIFGIRLRTTVYKVIKRKTGVDHALILLIPVRSWFGPRPTYNTQEIEDWQLGTLSVQQDNLYNRMRVELPTGSTIRTAKVGCYAVTNAATAIDETIATMARTAGQGFQFSTVQSFFGGNREVAAPLYEYYLTKTPERVPTIIPVENGLRRYQSEPENFDVKAKPLLKSFMSPIIHGAFAADKCLANERTAIKERITDIKPPEYAVTPEIHKAMVSFLRFLIPCPNELDPVPLEIVYERQFTKKQREELAKSEWSQPKRENKAFPKGEPAQKLGPQRIISTMNPVDKREYSRVIYSMERLLKITEWYAFSSSPLMLANKVARVCKDSKLVIASDFSRFDGRLPKTLRELENMALMRAFRPQYHTVINDLHRCQFNMKAKLPLGSKFNTGYARQSGSPETSLFNSMDNAFIAYLAFLRMGQKPEEAWNKLGVYGGDDGLTADIDSKIYVKVAVDLGMKLEAEPIYRGEFGIKFLARYYSPGIWFGQLDSICDMYRQASKIHVSANLPDDVTPTEKFLEKMYSLTFTDRNTPILGDLCRKAEEINGKLIENDRTEKIRAWTAFSEIDINVQYPNKKGTWMLDYLHLQMPDFQYDKFINYLNDSKDIKDLLNMPLFMAPIEPVATKPTVCEGQIYPLGIHLPPTESPDFKIGFEKTKKKVVKFQKKIQQCSPQIVEEKLEFKTEAEKLQHEANQIARYEAEKEKLVKTTNKWVPKIILPASL